MQSQSDNSSALSAPSRFQMVRPGLRRLLFVVALAGAAYSRLNAMPRPTIALNAHPHHVAVSAQELLRSHI